MEVLNHRGAIYPEKIGESSKDCGLGGLLFLTDCLIQLHRKVIQPADLVEIGVNIQQESLNYRIKFYEGEIYTVSHLIKLYIVTQSPQIPLILSTYVNRKTKTRSIDRVYNLAKSLSLDVDKIANITGRLHRTHKQGFNIYELEKIAQYWLTLSTPALEFLRTTQIEHRQEIFGLYTKLFEEGIVTHAFNWQEQQVFIALHALKKQYAIALDYEDNLTHDMVIEAALKNNKLYQAKSPKALELGEYTKVNLAGDLYLGEWYSRRRIKRNIKDYYSAQGAAYCYAKVKELFPEGELNIVNSESSVVNFDKIQSPYIENKKFILDANPDKLFAAFEDLNINAVLLANNHSYDFGKNGLRESLKYFEKANLPAIGVGKDLTHALTYYKVKAGQRNLYIFSVYWYRGNQYFSYDCYAKSNKPGVASINKFLFQIIQDIKLEDPKAFVLVSPHWGVDFKPTSGHQRRLARQLIQAGTDLVIGHGAHSLQSIEKINGKYVVFSLGNFLFNSDGEFDTHQAPKYGLFAQMDFGGNPRLTLKGLDADNLSTDFQPTLVSEEQFEDILRYYASAIKSGILQVDRENLTLTTLL